MGQPYDALLPQWHIETEHKTHMHILWAILPEGPFTNIV